MPHKVATSTDFIDTHLYPSELRTEVWDAMYSNPRNANVILPQTLKTLEAERRGESENSQQCWIVYSSTNSKPVVEFVLACLEGHIGSYPLFIFTTHSLNKLTYDYLLPRLTELAKTLRLVMPLKRIYSVFAPDPICQTFVAIWTKLTGVQRYAEPYYAAKISYCTQSSFRDRPLLLADNLEYKLRPGVSDDIPEIGHLCHDFAADSSPFFLSPESALKEATVLVKHNQIWVHRIKRRGDSHTAIASIVAFTRNSETNATITKVYTNPKWRQLGCAERLVRRVTEELLLTKDSVSLFVGHENKAAKVYDRVGFVGLNHLGPIDGVDDWLEIGFDRSKVDLGHW